MSTSSVVHSIPVAARVNRFSYAIRNIVTAAKAIEAQGVKVRYLNIGDPVPSGSSQSLSRVAAVPPPVQERYNRPNQSGW